MIYLLDQPLSAGSHSSQMLEILKRHTTVDIELIPFQQSIKTAELLQLVRNLSPRVLPMDIVLCLWAVEFDPRVNQAFDELAKLCFVVAAAGNFNQPIEQYSPASAEDVITVAALNKSGVKATMSNYSLHKKLVWVCGTNYVLEGKSITGTSVSAAVYAALLSTALLQHSVSVTESLVNQYNANAQAELNIS